MIEKIVLNYLLDCNLNMIGNKVYLETPLSPEAEYLVIQKTSSGKQDGIRSAMIAVQSRSQRSLLKAAEINEKVVEAMESMADTTEGIYSCKLNSDYNFTDTKTKEYRYQAVFNLFYN